MLWYVWDSSETYYQLFLLHHTYSDRDGDRGYIITYKEGEGFFVFQFFFHSLVWSLWKSQTCINMQMEA